MRTIRLEDLSVEDKRAALVAVGQRWSELLIELGGRPRAIPHDTDVALLVSAVRPLCHPMLTDDRIADLMFLLSVDVTAYDKYVSERTWEGEDSVLAGMVHDERVSFLQRGVDRQVFALMYAVEPCITCMNVRSFADWQPQSNATLHVRPYRCVKHDADEDEKWREWNKNHQRLLHDGARLTMVRDTDTFGGRP